MSPERSKPRRANGYAVVASIVLVAGVIVVSLRWGSIGSPRFDPVEMDDLAEHLAEQHQASLQLRDDAWALKTKEQAAYELSVAMAIDRLVVFDLHAAGLTFVGGQLHSEPVAAVGQLMYSTDDAAALSVFLVPNRGLSQVAPTLPMPDGRLVWMQWAPTSGDMQQPRAMLGSDEQFVYVLLSADTDLLQAVATRIGQTVYRR